MTQTPIDGKRQVVTEFRRSEILGAATKIFGAKGFEGTRVDDIAAEAGLAKATVYAYFRSKDEIYESAVEQALEELSALTERHISAATDFPSRLRAFIAVRLSFWHEKQTLYRVISSVNRDNTNRRRSLKWQKQAVNYLVHFFAKAAERGDIPHQDFDAAAWGLMDMIRGINERRILHLERSPQADVAILTDFALRGLGYRV